MVILFEEILHAFGQRCYKPIHQIIITIFISVMVLDLSAPKGRCKRGLGSWPSRWVDRCCWAVGFGVETVC